MARVKNGVIARAKHKKILKKQKATMVLVANYLRLQNKQ